MRVVAASLALQAMNCTDEREFDLFGRSAFNRFYYDAYLSARETLQRMDAGWAEQSHKQIPDLLRGAVVKRIKKAAKVAAESSQISIPESQRLVARASASAAALADLLRMAYRVRVVADYKIEKLVLREGQVARLDGCTLENAKHWGDKTRMHTGSILSVCESLGLV